MTEAAGVLSFHPTQTGVWFDFDGDGWLDLFIGNETRPGGRSHLCELFRNNHDGTFKEMAAAAGLAVRAFVKGVTSGDYNNDGRPDLYLSIKGGTRAAICSVSGDVWIVDGIEVKFTDALDEASANDLQNYSIEQWNYKWTKNYGSPEFSVADPEKKGRDKVEVKSARLGADRKTVFLEIPDLKPVMQMRIKFNLKAADGAPISTEIHNTINRVPVL